MSGYARDGMYGNRNPDGNLRETRRNIVQFFAGGSPDREKNGNHQTFRFPCLRRHGGVSPLLHSRWEPVSDARGEKGAGGEDRPAGRRGGPLRACPFRPHLRARGSRDSCDALYRGRGIHFRKIRGGRLQRSRGHAGSVRLVRPPPVSPAGFRPRLPRRQTGGTRPQGGKTRLLDHFLPPDPLVPLHRPQLRLGSHPHPFPGLFLGDVFRHLSLHGDHFPFLREPERDRRLVPEARGTPPVRRPVPRGAPRFLLSAARYRPANPGGTTAGCRGGDRMTGPGTPPSVSVIIPALNEAGTIAAAARSAREAGAGEVIVVDGESGDGTPDAAWPAADVVILSPPGRARQMNAGARAANGTILLFLPPDTPTPRGAR